VKNGADMVRALHGQGDACVGDKEPLRDVDRSVWQLSSTKGKLRQNCDEGTTNQVATAL
jgi:hypothetical protein